MSTISLLNPGLVPNDKDGTSCFLACTQMVMRAKLGGSVSSFDELSTIIRRKEGEYSWEYAILSFLANRGFSVKFISTFDLNRFVSEKEEYMYEYFGEEAAKDQIVHSNMENAYQDASEFVRSSNVNIETRVPEINDIKKLIENGYYLIPYVNQKIFQADKGYVAHTVVIYGYSERGVLVHNPGPPATEGGEIAWELFEKAWSSPAIESRIVFAVNPES